MNNKQCTLMGSCDSSWLEEVDGLCFTFSHMPHSTKWCSLTGHDGNAAQGDKRIEMNKYNREGWWLDWWMDDKEGGELSTRMSKLRQEGVMERWSRWTTLGKVVEEEHVLYNVTAPECHSKPCCEPPSLSGFHLLLFVLSFSLGHTLLLKESLSSLPPPSISLWFDWLL